MKKPVQHPEGVEGSKCYALGTPPIDTTEAATELPRFCEFLDHDENSRCCTTTHDIWLKGFNKRLGDFDHWPAQCNHKVYTGFESMSCAVCHPKQPDWTYFDPDNDIRVFRMCKSFIQKIYGNNNLDRPTSRFEKCGGWSDPDPVMEAIYDDDGTFSGEFEMETEEQRTIFPNFEYASARGFFLDFPNAKDGLQFMPEFHVMMVDDTDENGDEIHEDSSEFVCYKNAIALANMLPVVLAATAINFLV